MLHLAYLSLIRRPLSKVLLWALIAISCALPVFLLQTASGLYEGINRAVSPFPILVGDKGSPYQLVLHTIFFRDKPLGNMEKGVLARLASDERVKAVYPLAFGDNYRGCSIVGTTKDIFDYDPEAKKGPWLSISKGNRFEEEGDAVIGSEAARLMGLSIGDTFRSIHGGAAKGKEHDHPFRVVGILREVKGPYDTAIFVNIHDIWEAHGKAALAKEEVTALLVVPKGYKEAMQLLGSYQKAKDVQMVFPSQSIISLYAMVGQTKDFWKLLTAFLLVMSLLVTLLSMYWSTLGRLSEIALLRAMGAGNTDIARFLLAEEALLLLAGSLTGWALGYLISRGAASLIAAKGAIVMDTAIDPLGLSIIPAVVLLGTAAALLPAGMVLRRDVAEEL